MGIEWVLGVLSRLVTCCSVQLCSAVAPCMQSDLGAIRLKACHRCTIDGHIQHLQALAGYARRR